MSTGARFLVWLVSLSVAGPGTESGTPPDLVINGGTFQIPAGETLPLEASSDELPAPVRGFYAQRGEGWLVDWDPLLGTPRFAYPLGREAIVAPEALGSESNGEELKSAVRAFLEEHEEFFGVSSAELTEPAVFAVGGSWLLVFGQTTPGGIPLRGANLRVVVRADGTLAWLKAFLAADCPDPSGPLVSPSAARVAWGGEEATLRRARLQMSFPDENSPRAIPTWSFKSRDADGGESEYLVDARDGSLLVRRRVVRFSDGRGGAETVDVEGWVRGWFLDDDGQAQRLPVKGSVIRDAEGRVAGVADDLGQFDATIPAGTLRGDDGETTLTASLEYGYCVPDGSECFDPGAGDGSSFHRVFQVLPHAGALLPGDDANGDGVPDVVLTQPARFAFAFTFHHGAPVTEARSWWLTAQEQSYDATAFTERIFRAAAIDHPPFAPLECLEVKLLGEAAQYLAYSPSQPCSSLWSGLRLPRLDDDLQDEPIAPSLLLHEVGHHTFFNVTGAADGDPPDIEEGVADVLAGMAMGEPRIGYLQNGQATSRAFSLERLEESETVRTAARQAVGNGFWALHEQLRIPADRVGLDLEAGEITVGAQILFLWLAFHRVREEDDRLFGRENDLLEQLLLIDDLPVLGGDGNLQNRTPHWEPILHAFRGRRFFEARFRRGDSNLDTFLNLTDVLGILNFLFTGQGPFHDCLNTLDTNNEGGIDISDALFLLNYLYLNGRRLPYPGTLCGFDAEPPWDPENLGCYETSCTPRFPGDP